MNEKSIDDNYENKMLSAFVYNPDKFLFYKDAFAKIKNGQSVWSWWGFLYTYNFLLYRRVINFPVASLLWLFDSIIFIIIYLLSPVLYFCLVIGLKIFFGINSMNYIFNKYENIKKQIESLLSEEEKRINSMQRAKPNLLAVIIIFFIELLVSMLLSSLIQEILIQL